MEHTITNDKQAQAVLNYFNGFHDGFIKQLALKSQDKFEERGVQLCSGNLDLEITFAHYNYEADRRPYDQVIKARFFQVRDLSIDFSGKSYEWSILDLSISQTERAAETDRQVRCMQATLTQNRLHNRKEWQPHTDLAFTFQYAEFSEL